MELAIKLEIELQNDRLLYDLGMITTDKALEGGLSALHVIMWKFIIIDFVQVDTNNRPFDAVQVWKATMRRTHGRLQAQAVRVRRKVTDAWGLGKPTPPLGSDVAEAPPGRLPR